jgi:DNA-binding phage protein
MAGLAFCCCVVDPKIRKTEISLKPSSFGRISNSVKSPVSKSYQSYLVKSLQDPKEAAAYLEAVLDNGSMAEVRIALMNVAEAQISASDDAQILSAPQDLYSSLSSQDEVSFRFLFDAIDELGFEISIKAKKTNRN